MEARINVKRVSLSVLLGVTSANLMAQSQTGPIVMGAGYDYPAPVYVAPGQLVTLFVQGIPLGTVGARAPGNSDLPGSLAGVSVGANDYGGPGTTGLQFPILEVRPFQTCLITIPPHCLTPTGAVTVQVPFEVRLNSLGLGDAELGVAVANSVGSFGTALPPFR
jgi:hypothetical protein